MVNWYILPALPTDFNYSNSRVEIILLFSAALVEGTIFCMHGGLSPDLVELDQVSAIVLRYHPLTKVVFRDHRLICIFFHFNKATVKSNI